MMFAYRSTLVLLLSACLQNCSSFVLQEGPRLSLSVSSARFDSSLRVLAAATNDVISTRKQLLSVITTAGSTLLLGSSAARAEGIVACKKDPAGAPANCVSTASVKQVDLYMAPWTWPEGTATEEVIARLKGAISADSLLSLEEQSVDKLYLRVKATRNFATDELEFQIKPEDRIVTFRSQQIDGPTNVSDFGANRKRLEELRKRTKVLNVMGAEFSSADAGPREGAVGQLKAFWGLQSGGGYESVLLGDE